MAKKSSQKTARNSAPVQDGSSLEAISMEALEREMMRRKKAVDSLKRKRDRLAAQLTELDSELRALGMASTASGATRKRPRNEASLADSLISAMKNRVMSVTDAADAVVAAGYQTTSSSFRTIVNQTLLKDARFEKVGRGRYKVAK